MKSKTSSIFFVIFIIGIIFLIYRNWFSHTILSALDIPFFYSERLREFNWQLYAWNSNLGDGLGGSSIPFLNIDTFLAWGIRLLVLTLNIPWNLSVRLLFFWPFIVICFLSSYLFVHSIIKEKLFSLLGSLVYLTNTYILMVVGGGQMGLALAYAMCPLVLFSYLRKSFFLLVLTFTALLLFDYRLSFLISIVLFFSIFFNSKINAWWEDLLFLVKSFILSFSINGFWLLPGLLSSSFSLPTGYGKSDWLPFLSVATFSNSLSLLHPNWPENIFGKTYFMRAEFLILPIIVFSSLIFVKHIKSQAVSTKYVIFFAFIGLVGVLFAKGVNPPFGSFYSWFFSNIPFFNVFRDPTKFYLLIGLSYSLLIPYSLLAIVELVKNTKAKIYVYPSYSGLQPDRAKKLIRWVYTPLSCFAKQRKWGILLVFVFYWLILLAPVWKGDVKGTFAKITIPDDYYRLEKLVGSDSDFNRVLVVPWNYRFVFSSSIHPVLDASRIFKTTQIQEIVNNFNTAPSRALLEKLSVKYVVVPDDFTQEIFLTERKYDEVLRTRVTESLDKPFFLHKVSGFKNLGVYTIDSYKNLFYSLDEIPAKIQFWQDSPIKFTVFIQDAKKPSSIVFGEKFDPNWKLWDGENIKTSQITKDGLNSFLLNKSGTYQVTIYYTSQNLLQIGERISLVTILIIIIFGLFKILKQKKVTHRTILAVIILLVLISLLFILFRHKQDVLKIKDKNIWWSKAWIKETIPFDKSSFVSTKYGGNELRFVVKESSYLSLTLSGWASGIQTFIDGKIVMYVTEDWQNKIITIPLKKNTLNNIRIRAFCSGPPECLLLIKNLKVSSGGKIISTQKISPKTIAIIGDSISNTNGPEGYSYFLAEKLGYSLHNTAIFGSTLSGDNGQYQVSQRFKDDIIKYKPDIVLILIGANDINKDISQELFLKNYDSLLSSLKENLIGSRIYTIGLLPRYDTYEMKSESWSKEIENLSQKYKIPYLNIGKELNKSDYQDELHPSNKSQEKIANTLFMELTKH